VSVRPTTWLQLVWCSAEQAVRAPLSEAQLDCRSCAHDVAEFTMLLGLSTAQLKCGVLYLTCQLN
jgi:hypothetical protein